jgi:capsular polysaccharide biosynthesis protein
LSIGRDSYATARADAAGPMNPEDAEEYTKGLGQIVAGVWRQMDEGARLGVPQALGLSASEWVETRLGRSSGTPERPDTVEDPAARHEAVTGARNQRKSLLRRVFRGLREDSLTTPDEPGLRPDAARIRLRRSPRHWLIIPVCGVLGMFGGLIWAAATPPVYESQAAAFVSMTALPTEDPSHNDPFGGSQFALQRVQSYAQLATSPQVLQAAMHDLHRGDGTEVARNVKVSAGGGVMLWVSVEDRDPQTAAHVADAVMANLVRSVAALEADGGQRSPIQLVPVQPAIVPDTPAGKGGFIKSLLSLLAGLGLGGAAFYFIRSRRGGQRYQSTAKNAEPVRYQKANPKGQRTVKNAEPVPHQEADPEHHDAGDVVVLRVGDGRDFPKRAGR